MVMEDQEVGLASECIPVPRVHDSLVEVKQEAADNTVTMSEDKKEDNKTGQRKPRHRKKALHAAIIKQMEFYFSDANLSKDRFLSNLIQSDPYVSLSTFIEFNKIRALTTETTRIAKALEASKILSLSEDGTKVCRNTPINPRTDSDDYTIYVQGLPPDADHDWLISIFSEYGSVAYVSIPRYKRNKKLKGFAFVEFDNVEGTEKCLKAFQDKNCVLPSHTSPDEILSITTFSQEEDSSLIIVKKVKNTSNNIEIESTGKKNTTDSKKRALSSPAVSSLKTDEDIPTKKIKVQESNTEEMETSLESKVENEKSKVTDDEENVKVNDVKTEDQVVDKESKENDEKKKKKRKRKNRGNKNEQQQLEEELEQSEVIDFGFRIMAKKEWKKLRNKYLQSQRDKMKQLKQHLLKKSNRYAKQSPFTDKVDTAAINTTEEQDKNSTKQTSAPKFSFAEGLIIKMELDEPCSNPKNLKNEIKSAANPDMTTPADIQYIDVREGDSYVYVRCDTAANASKLMKNYFEDKSSVILTGDEEKGYWDKMFKDREQKFVISKKNRVKQRGRDKLLKKAEKELGKHIRFDD